MKREKIETKTIVKGSVVEEKVPFMSKFTVSFADGMTATLNGLITASGLTYYYVTYLGLSSSWASFAWILFGIWNAINDPIFGFITDHTHSKLGRRIPFIRYGAPLIAAAFILTWFPWDAASQGWLMAQMLICLFLFDTLYTAIASALYVMPFEMAVTNKARSGIIIWKMLFSLISMGVPLVLFPIIRPEIGADDTVFQLIMVGIAIVAGLIIWLSTYFYKENGYIQEEKQMGIIKSIAYCFKNKAFLLFEVISWTVIFAQTILMTGLTYYKDAYSAINSLFIYIPLVIGAAGGLLFWVMSYEKLGLKVLMIIMCAAFATGLIIMLPFGTKEIGVAFAFLLIGAGFSGGMYLIPLLNGDVIDYDESKTGLRREGMYAGVNSLVTKPAISIANSIFLGVLGWFSYDFDIKAALQTSTAKYGIIVAWVAFAALFVILSLVAMCFYPLHGKAWADEKNKLAIIHRDKQAKFEKEMLAKNLNTNNYK